MLVKLSNQSWLVLASHILSEEVSVVGGALSTKLVWSSLVVVGTQMAQDSWGHVSMIWARSNGWEQHRTSLLVALSSNEPARKDDG